jgi:hypothetical protein
MTTTLNLDGMGEINYNTRLTSGFRKINNQFKAFSFHMSEPSAEQEEDEFFPLHFGTEVFRANNQKTHAELMELVKEILPGGVMGSYAQPDLPLYVINDKMLQMLGYTYDEFVLATNQKMINLLFPEDRAKVL